MIKLVVIATDGEDREDGSIYYSQYYLVTAKGELCFSEPEFSPEFSLHTGYFKRLRSLGYTLDRADALILSGDYSIVTEVVDT